MANVKKQLEELKAFMTSSVYSSFQATVRVEIERVNQEILYVRPANADDLSRMQYNFGVRDERQNLLNFFEDSRASLEELLGQLTAERETKLENN